MSRRMTILLLLILTLLSQALTAAALRWLPIYLHIPNGLLRPLLMMAMTAGLLALLLGRAGGLSRGEHLSLLFGTAGGLANLVDTLVLGGVADFILVAPATLASPGDFLILGGFFSFLPISLRQAYRGTGLYGSCRRWRRQICTYLLQYVPL